MKKRKNRLYFLAVFLLLFQGCAASESAELPENSHVPTVYSKAELNPRDDANRAETAQKF